MNAKISLLKWTYSLIAAFIGGASTSATNLLVAPESFNFSDAAGVKKVLISAAVSGILAVALYLKQSPLPYYDFEGGDVKPGAGTGTGDGSKLPLIFFLAGAVSLGGVACSSVTWNSPSAQAIAASAVEIAAFEASQKFDAKEKAKFKEFLENVALAAESLKGTEGLTVQKLIDVIEGFAGDFKLDARVKFYIGQIATITGGVIRTPADWDAWLERLTDACDKVSVHL